ncbi:hypothetical protein PG989_007649 [Apiospora arundinis]|uniref:Uncharacterized protein n=1 Tax=Apiospora arundinis TaxID=335852 RepID=A0ABR2J3Z5_9PEZI
MAHARLPTKQESSSDEEDAELLPPIQDYPRGQWQLTRVNPGHKLLAPSKRFNDEDIKMGADMPSRESKHPLILLPSVSRLPHSKNCAEKDLDKLRRGILNIRENVTASYILASKNPPQ